ncbi:hypothetical protein ACFS07_00575 [Undibacterium arcticum]
MNIHGIAKPIYRAFQFMLQFGDVRYPTEGNHETVAVWVGRKNRRRACTDQHIID